MAAAGTGRQGGPGVAAAGGTVAYERHMGGRGIAAQLLLAR
jgi:hypothetical protein